MAVREVLIYPDPRLKIEAAEVVAVTDDVKQVIADLIDTMNEAGHSTGIAATQIGEDYRIVVIDASKSRKPCENHGLMALINPEIIDYNGVTQSREGCMSVPDFTGNVKRAESVVVQYQDENMELKALSASGFEAILVQHEMDHLDGILFVDRVISKRTDLFRRKGR